MEIGAMEKQPLLEKREVTSISNTSYGTFFLQIEQVKQAEQVRQDKQAEYDALKRKHFAEIAKQPVSAAYFGEEPKEANEIVLLFENAFKALAQKKAVAMKTEDVINQLMVYANRLYANQALLVKIENALYAQTNELAMAAASQAAP